MSRPQITRITRIPHTYKLAQNIRRRSARVPLEVSNISVNEILESQIRVIRVIRG